MWTQCQWERSKERVIGETRVRSKVGTHITGEEYGRGAEGRKHDTKPRQRPYGRDTRDSLRIERKS